MDDLKGCQEVQGLKINDLQLLKVRKCETRVILLLVGVLFIGVTAWKEGANRAACVLNISSMQKAVRSFQNSNELAVGAACTMASIAGTGLYFAAPPTCPTAGSSYTVTGTIPAVGVIWAACGNTPAHTVKAGSFANW